MTPEITRVNPFGAMVEAQGANDSLLALDVDMLRELVWKERLIVLRGFRPFDSTDDFTAYCERWGEISIWPFGKVLELIERANPEDHIFDNNYVPLHWDGMYRPQVPEFQIFRCVRAPALAQGGRTVFANTVSAIERASEETLELWRRVTGRYQRKMEYYDSTSISPLLDTHPLRGFQVLRYNEPPDMTRGHFLNPPLLNFTGIEPDEQETLHRSLKEALYAPESFYAHAWREGDVVIADNFSLLHGREGFTSQAPRELQRVHVLSNPPLNNPRLVSYS